MGFSIWHWVVIALIGLAIWGAIALSRWSRRAEKPGGVGGWIALLIAGLMVLGPLLTAGRLNSDILSAESAYPNLLTVTAWTNYKQAAWWCFGASAVFGIYAGWSLARKRNPSVPMLAIAAVWVLGPMLSLILSLVLPAIFFGAPALSAQDWGQLLPPFITASLWTLYLLRSKRVKGLYNMPEKLGAPQASS